MIQVLVNEIDVTNQIVQGSLNATLRLTHQVDTASFNVLKAGSKTLEPSYGDTVAIYDGASKIFGGIVIGVDLSPVSGAEGSYFSVHCVDHTYEMDKILAAKTYTNTSVEEIIADLLSSYTTGFTTTNVASTFVIEKIVFNQVTISTCIKRLADILNYDWYVDQDKDVHFFDRYTNPSPFDVTDDNGSYIPQTLKRISDGSEVVNRVKVRGGEYDGVLFSDSITVSGNDSKSFKLPYRFANLTVTVDTGGGPVSQNVGIDFIDDFTTDDVLYNFQEQVIRFENSLSAGDIIAFSGNPKVPVFAVSEDPVSIGTYGTIEKLIRDDSIESNVIARRRANAELYAYSEPIVDVKFRTYTSGLRAGQLINVQSTIQSIDDDLIIKQVAFKMRDHDNFEYTIDLVSTRRYDFITLLQKILTPEPRASDAQEVSEEIFTDTQIITFLEETEFVAAFEDDAQQVQAQENYILNPLGAGVNATYVLGPYTPTGQTDTKRPGRLGISFVVY